MFYENFFTNKVDVKMKSVKMHPNIFWKRGICNDTLNTEGSNYR